MVRVTVQVSEELAKRCQTVGLCLFAIINLSNNDYTSLTFSNPRI